MLKNYLFVLLAACLVSSCAHKVDGVRLDEELEPFWILFEEEAAERGIVFDNGVEQIEGYLQNIVDNGVIGACRRNDGEGRNRSVFIDKPYWVTATQLEKEYVVFHELGHCFLLLDHDDTENDNGECVSIMASGLGNCRDNYNELTREELLDELFSK
ncbi:MAG: hypothetical protein AAGA77_19845 [Bacteroidota bacterium]